MCVKQTKVDPDRLRLKGKRGTWLRYGKLFFRCRMPWVLLAIYIVLSFIQINLGIDETGYTARLFAGDTSPTLLVQLITVTIINLVAGSLMSLFDYALSAYIDQNMRSALIDKVTRLPMSYFKHENPRDAIYRIVNSATVISKSVHKVIVPLITSIYALIAVFKEVFGYDWRLSIVLLGFLPLQFAVTFIFGRLSFSSRAREADVNASLMDRLAEMVTNIPLAKAFAKEQREAEMGKELTGRIYRVNVKISWLNQLWNSSDSVFTMLESVVMVLVGALLLRGGDITTEAWVAFFMFSSLFNFRVRSLQTRWTFVKEIQGNAERVAEIMDAPEEDLSGEPCRDLRGDLELKNVRFAYEENQTVLTNASCVFPDNCVTALLGVSGCGKTTMVNLLTRLYDPQSGEITVAGKDIRSYALDDYREQFVVVSQDGMLFSGTIRENVCYGNETASDAELEHALRRARIYDFVMGLPHGLDTRLEEYGKNLSGGQRQRLIMARALLSKARYFILDEPVSAMDAIAASELMEVLDEVSKDRCVIIIAHTAAVLSLAERVVVVEDGVVSAQGPVAKVAEHSQFLREFIGKESAK